MREILFRGKRECTGDWVFGGFHSRFDRAFIIGCSKSLRFDGCEVIPATIGQFTGLTDKNGKRIFEGDKIALPTTDEVGFVEWSEDDARFSIWFDAPGTPIIIDFDAVWGHECEVIGNIHDNNPELLKGE